MPITPGILPLLLSPRAMLRPHGRRLFSPALALTVAVLLASPASASSKFTVVVGGKIVPVDAMRTKGQPIRVSAQAVVEMARALPGTGLSFEAETGVVSITREGGDASGTIDGFKPGARTLTFVIDGKIATSPAIVSRAGIPFLPAAELKAIAERIGFSAELDEKAGVLALTASPGRTGSSAASGGAGSSRPSYGIDGTFMESIAAGAALGGGQAGSAGGVCGYMDTMKTLWVATEPSHHEKETLKQLATLFQSQVKAKAAGNPADLKRLEDTLRSFDAKVQRRLSGTASSSPPGGASAWHAVSVGFLEKVDLVMKVSFDLIRVMKLPPDKQNAEEEQAKRNVGRLKSLNAQVQSIGTRQVQETISVRASHGCAPP